VIDPTKPATYVQAEEMLKLPRCVGIKVHPEEHGYPIAEHGRTIFEFAAHHRAVVLAHSSEQNSLASDYARLANAFPEMKLIIAHLGCGWDGDLTHQVRAIQQSRHGNLFTDTSSARSITPNLIEWAVKEVGADRILFGTDSPLYFTAMQRARIDNADLSEQEKRLILCENARKLFGFDW
jgi:predicted TIM-barrel fold metal-dependent hydrolase